MNSARRIVVFGVLSWLLSSCQYMNLNHTYSGIYFLERSREISLAQAEEIAQSLRVELTPFGFFEAGRAEYPVTIFFDRERRTGSAEIRNLPGSEASVSVAIQLAGRYPGITIQDMSNTVETDFMRALKRSIERCLEDNGIPGARFERQNDIFN